jgi:hypothetical protein
MKGATRSRDKTLAEMVRFVVAPVLLVFFLAGCAAVKEHWQECTSHPDQPDCRFERLPSGK